MTARMARSFVAGHKAFLSMLHVEVSQNNPIALCFIEILRQAARGTHRTPSASSQSPLYVVEGGINSATEGKPHLMAGIQGPVAI